MSEIAVAALVVLWTLIVLGWATALAWGYLKVVRFYTNRSRTTRENSERS